MKRPWLLAVVGLVAIVFAIGAVACSDDDKDKNGDNEATPTESINETPTEAAGTTPEATTAGTAEPGAEIAPITMEAVGDAGASGTASITQTTSGGTEVVVTIDSGLEEGSHLSHIHHGNCSDPTGEIHVNLTNVDADASGAGTATTTDPQPPDGTAAPAFDHYLAREHYVAVHALTGEVVSCGDVVAAQ